jgi:hypothetical protein
MPGAPVLINYSLFIFSTSHAVFSKEGKIFQQTDESPGHSVIPQILLIGIFIYIFHLLEIVNLRYFEQPDFNFRLINKIRILSYDL